jgi:hypothetical protein
MYNREIICPTCKEEEKKREDYEFAREAERRAVLSGNYNYKGVGLAEEGDCDG